MLEQTAATSVQTETAATADIAEIASQPLVEAEVDANEQARYVVRLPAFEGPLDLLLHLIEKRQMEITTISLVAVTDQYIEYLRQWQDHPESLPLANMAAFVSIAT